VRKLTEANSANAELAHVSVGATTELATVVRAHCESRLEFRLFNQALLSQIFLRHPSPTSRCFSGIIEAKAAKSDDIIP